MHWPPNASGKRLQKIRYWRPFSTVCANSSTLKSLLPLNRPWRLGSYVINDAVNAADFINDAVRNVLQHFMRKVNPVGGHAVFRVDCTEGASVSVSALVSHYADRHDGKQDGERLPDL